LFFITFAKKWKSQRNKSLQIYRNINNMQRNLPYWFSRRIQ